jgi:putative cell wall-binding protein
MEMRKFGKVAMVLVALGILVAAIGMGVSWASPTYSITGNVTFAGQATDASETVVVHAYAYNYSSVDTTFAWHPAGPASNVATDGTFTIPSLPAGTYRIGFTDASHAYQPVFYDTTSTVDAATDISIVDTDAAGIAQDLTAVPKPVLKGTVHHVDGDWADASITAVPYHWENHLTVGNVMAYEWVAYPGSTVASDGTYSIEGGVDFPAGDYRIAFQDANGVYNTRFYPAVDTTVGAATDVTWAGTADVAGIDTTLVAAPERKIAGTVHFVGGTQVSGDVNAEIYSQDASGTWNVVYTAPIADDGTYFIHPSADATYHVGFSDAQGAFSPTFYDATSTVDVANDVAVVGGTANTGINATMTVVPSVRNTGSDAIASALQASAAYDDGFGGPVVLCSADNWADSISAGPYARAIGAPELLVHKGRVPSEVMDELGRLDPSEVIIIGSPNSVSFDVENDLRQAGIAIVRRLGGADAYGTSAAVAQEMVTRGLTITGDGGKLVNVAIVGGLDRKVQSPYDAMVAAPVASAQEMPILLVKKTTVPAAVADFLASNESTETNVLLVGGEAIVSADLESQLTPATDPAETLTRVAGTDRYATSVALAKYAQDNFGFSNRKVAITTSSSAAQALSLASVIADRNEALLLTAPVLKKKAVGSDFPGVYTWLSPATESFISNKAAFASADPHAFVAVIDSIGATELDVWNYALKTAGIQ